MILRKRAASLFFILSLLFALLSMPVSAAISQGRLERGAVARVAEDDKGILQLKGFSNEAYDMNGSYSSFGSITNNTNQSIILTVTVKPEYTLNHLFSRFGIKIGSEVCEFRFSSSSPKKITLTMKPGQRIDVQAYLIQNLFSMLTTEFEFTAKDASGTYTMQLASTSRTPRRMITY